MRPTPMALINSPTLMAIQYRTHHSKPTPVDICNLHVSVRTTHTGAFTHFQPNTHNTGSYSL